MTAWPDWHGRAVALVASGPSLKKNQVEALSGRLPVAVVKRNVELAPWADVVYGCDFPWWRSVNGLPHFGGLRLAYDERACAIYGLTRVQIPDKHSDRLLFDETGVVGAGGNSGFQLLNLVVQFGATRVLLLGFDLHDRGGVHWYGRNTDVGMANPGEENFRRWRRAFGVASEQLAARGVSVINASPDSELKCFRRADAGVALKEWGLA